MFKKIKSKIKELIKTRKINIFLLFLGLAFGILLLTKLSKTYTNTFVFDINKINVPEEEVIINDSSLKLELTIKAHGFELLKYHLTRPSIPINFEEQITKTDSVYIWTRNKAFAALNNQFNKNVEIVNIIPDSLRFRYDIYAVKKVPISLNSNIYFSPGYNLDGKIVIKPDSIKVIGAEALVNAIDIIETDTLKMDNVKQNIVETIHLQYAKLYPDLKFSESQVTVSAKVEKHTEGTLDIPVEIINVPNTVKLKYFPRTVPVSYYTSLASFNEIEANQFKVICDYSALENENYFLVPKLIKKPETVKHANIKHEYIEFIIIEE